MYTLTTNRKDKRIIPMSEMKIGQIARLSEDFGFRKDQIVLCTDYAIMNLNDPEVKFCFSDSGEVELLSPGESVTLTVKEEGE